MYMQTFSTRPDFIDMILTQDMTYRVGMTYVDFGKWICHADIIQNLRRLAYQGYVHFPEWLAHAFFAARSFFVAHPHIVHIASFAIFFGPIVILLPLLLAHELIIATLFNLSFALHGLLPGSLEDRYVNLHLAFEDIKGSIFSFVDALGTKYNKFTTEYWPLAVVRLSCFILGSVTLYYIMSEKQRQIS